MGFTICKSIGDIKEQYQAASVNELPEFIACWCKETGGIGQETIAGFGKGKGAYLQAAGV